MLEYTDGFYRAPTPELAALRDEAEAAGVPIISRGVEVLLRSILSISNPKIIMEIGAAVGYSASVFAATCRDSVILSCEKDPEMVLAARNNLRKMGLDGRVRILEGDYTELDIKKSVAESGFDFERADFLFIDAAKGQYRKFWDKSFPLMKKDALIICDNVLQKGAAASDDFPANKRFKTSVRRMRDFLEFISADKSVDTVVLPLGDGISISRVVISADCE